MRGNLAGSWEGLDPEVNIGCWYYEKRAESLEWFSRRGHRLLIAGYYDADPKLIRNWLSEAKKVKGVTGVMYTTWRNNFRDLEEFARVIEESR